MSLLYVRVLKSIAFTVIKHNKKCDKSLKVRFLLPLFYHCQCSKESSSFSVSPSYFQKLIYQEIQEKPWAFSNIFWAESSQFDDLIMDPDLFVRVLKLIKIRPRVALRFFRWAERQPGFKHSEEVFCTILEILVRNDLLPSAYYVMERAVSVNLNGIGDVLVDVVLFRP